MSSPTLLTREKLEYARMTPLNFQEIKDSLTALAKENLSIKEVVDLEKDDSTSFTMKIVNDILDELELVERSYRPNSTLDEEWLDVDKGGFLSVTTRDDFTEEYPKLLQANEGFSEKDSFALRDLVLSFVKSRAPELAKNYDHEFIE